MSDTISPNMGLVIPGVGTEPGPQWATDLNSSLTILDAHNHSPGNGVQITPTGLNINSDLPFNGNNQTLIRSSRYSIQGSPLSGALDLGCVYVSGVDLYFNDENGNQIQITKNGGIAGTSGSIANLTSPASASYVSGTSTFVWQSAANTAANMDNGSITIRKLTASSPGITISAPSSLSGNYTLTLPVTPPSVNSVLVMDNSGNVTTTATPDSLIITNTITSTSGDIDATVGNVNASNVIAANNINAGFIIRAGQSVFPGGGSNAAITASNVDNLDAITSVGTFPLAISRVNSTAAFISGAVDATGTIVSGGDFTASLIGSSGPSRLIQITFTTNFSNTPTIITSATTAVFTVTQESAPVLAGTVSPSGFQIAMGSYTGAVASFVAFGSI